MGRRTVRFVLSQDEAVAIRIFCAYEVNMYLTRYVWQVHFVLGLVLMPDADLSVPESGEPTFTHEFACIYSRSKCSSQTLA